MKYDIILADPPWTFSVWNKDKSDRYVGHKYDLMDTQAICDLPLGKLIAKDAVLFLWATWPNLLDALRVIEAWGFTYKTEAWVWVKANKNGFGHFTGMGYYTRSNTEICLLATKGTPLKVASHSIQALIYAPVMEHSRKPDDQYRKIEALYPDRNYLELFARRKRPGWHSWGNEIRSDIEIMSKTLRGDL